MNGMIYILSPSTSQAINQLDVQKCFKLVWGFVVSGRRRGTNNSEDVRYDVKVVGDLC